LFVALSFEIGSLPRSWFDTDTIPIESYLEVHASFSSARNVVVLMISVVIPVYQTYSAPFAELWSNCESLLTFESLLKDIVCVQYFRSFLTSLNQLYLIQSWVTIEVWKDQVTPNPEEARKIYERYFGHHAELETKITSYNKKRLEEALNSGKITFDMFDDVQYEVFELMKTLFPRFLASDSCRECLRELEAEENIRDLLVKSDMIERVV